MKHAITLIFLVAPLLLSARTWTNTDGKSIEAEFVEMIDDDTVKVRMDSTRRVYEVPVESLSELDQTYLKSLEKEKILRETAEKLSKRRARWGDDLENAIEESREYNIPVMMLFTGSDWCGYCIQLEENVLSSKAFKEYANENLVLLILDFPRKGPKKEAKGIAESYEVSGYPTVHFINYSQERLGRLGGYGGDSPEEYISKIEKIFKSSKKTE